MKKIVITVRDQASAKIWSDVERTAKVVETWPEWKRLGSGLLDSTGEAATTCGDVPASRDQAS